MPSSHDLAERIIVSRWRGYLLFKHSTINMNICTNVWSWSKKGAEAIGWSVQHCIKRKRFFSFYIDKDATDLKYSMIWAIHLMFRACIFNENPDFNLKSSGHQITTLFEPVKLSLMGLFFLGSKETIHATENSFLLFSFCLFLVL